MPMDKKQMLMLAGGTIVIGGIVIYVMSRGKSIASTTPVAVQSLGVPSMPVASIPPVPIDVSDSPYYNTFNFPDSRQRVIPPKPNPDCPCKGVCDSGLGIGAIMNNQQSTQFYRVAAPTIAKTFTGNANPGASTATDGFNLQAYLTYSQGGGEYF